MIIGIPKETKNNEHRVALTPSHVAKLIKKGHRVFIEEDAGKVCRFYDGEYMKAGAIIKGSVDDCEMIVRVKEPEVNKIKQNQIIMGYLHIEKGQNPKLLKKLMQAHTTSYAYEEIRDKNHNRLVNLGFEAGIVGMYEGLRQYGKILKNFRRESKFFNLKPIQEYFTVDNINKTLSKMNLRNGVDIYILGKGQVSKGVQEILRHSQIKANVLYRDKTKNIEKFLEKADIIVNAIDWYPNEPHILRREHLKKMKKTSLIVDISCDKNGGIETCIPTNWEEPTYVINGITHSCIDNLPSAIPRDSSIHLGDMILPHVIKIANGEKLNSGMMTNKGSFVYDDKISKVTKKELEKEIIAV